MELFSAAIEPDGTCLYVDMSEYGERVETTWPNVAAWVQAWTAEQRSDDTAEQIGPAWQFVHCATDEAIPGVVNLLVEPATVHASSTTSIALLAGVRRSVRPFAPCTSATTSRST